MQKKIDSILKDYFGYNSLRKGQKNIINKILNKEDVLGIMTTGSGKSICYQLPALIFDGLTIVISPLISLMKDQVDALKIISVKAEYLNSSLNYDEYKKVLYDIFKGKVKILYISPEKLENKDFINFLNKIKISMIVIDEAHCVSQWGDDFRKSYLNIANFREEMSKKNDVVTLALTATATPRVKKDIINKLRIKSPFIYTDSLNRDNIFFEVHKIGECKYKSKEEFINDFVLKNKDRSGIIYCSTRKKVDDLALYINNILCLKALKYHAGLSSKEREKNQEIFLKDDVKIMIATNAFGMGINKSNIRYVIHYNIPKDIESYYQEAGRAGRDGLKSNAILLFDAKDISTQKFLIDQDITASKESKIEKYKRLDKIVSYCDTDECYREYILKYFGEKIIRSYCGYCSNCLDKKDIKDYSIEAKKIISCIGRAKEKIGISTLTNTLIGRADSKMINKGLDKLSTFGIMSDVDYEWLENFIQYMLTEKYIMQTAGSYPVVILGEKYKDILDDKIRIIRKNDEKIQIDYFENELFKRLVDLRKEIADKENVKPYIIFSDITIIEMAEKKPKNRWEMIKIKGVGNQKFKRYGEIFLKEINQ